MWLSEIENKIPLAKEKAEYWICRARLAESDGDDALAVDLFEQAVRHKAKVSEK